jgi:hypothetical protein
MCRGSQPLARSIATLPAISEGSLRPSGRAHFYFLVATAHDILRHNGLPIGKREYLGFGRE